jgi:hypothetical protein
MLEMRLMPDNVHLRHGGLRGLERVQSSQHFAGRFGRMFRSLEPADFDEKDLRCLAAHMIAGQNIPSENEVDPEEDSAISAGYTYLGQFIDHDLTFDPVSSLQRDNDPDALVDFRSPRFDLDCLYGRGPDDQPYLYTSDGRMLLGRGLLDQQANRRTHDLPRHNNLRALIGDPRNDANIIVSQLHAMFLCFHNRIANHLHAERGDFPMVQRLVRWHYQWVVLHDFLPTIIGWEMLDSILPHLRKKTSILQDKPNLQFYTWRNEPFIPVEFSVAAYRFGHSMVRPIYRLNGMVRRAIFTPGVTGTDLMGFRAFPDNWGIAWNRFFQIGPAPQEGLQRAYKIDSSLVHPLGHLPASMLTEVSSLAELNLRRGLRMGLPSGQAVARKMGQDVIPDDQLKVGKATVEDSQKNKPLLEISKKFRDNAPLWYYILAEAQHVWQSKQAATNQTPIRLGPVGGRIVGEVFAGLLLGDRHSFLNQDPKWQPIPAFTNNGTFGMAELITQAMQE